MQPLGADEPAAVGPYRLLGRLGSGGMGRVYLGRSAGGRTVAVKIVHPQFASDEEFRARFRREVDAARRVGGAWTAPVLDADPDAPVPWAATGYAAGPSLAAAVTDLGPLPVLAVRALGAGLAEALATVHGLGLVHRDVKPSNVLLTLDGPLLIDFGIARATDGTTSLTSTGVSVGSPGYMAPEQILGRPVTGAADVFSLGAVLAYAATGSPPFSGGSPAALLYKVVHEEPELGSLRGHLGELVTACLDKDPERRPTPAGVVRRLAPEGAAVLMAGGWLPAPLVEQVSRSAVRLLNLEAAADEPSGPVGFTSPAVEGDERQPAPGGFGPPPPMPPATAGPPPPHPPAWPVVFPMPRAETTTATRYPSPPSPLPAPGKVTVSVAATSTPGESGRGRRLSCTVALAVAGALAAATLGLGALLHPWTRHGDDTTAGSRPGHSATSPSPSATSGRTGTGAIPARYLGTWEGDATALDGTLAMGTFRLTVHQAAVGQELGRLRQTDQVGGVCTDILTLKEVTPTRLTATSTGAKGNHAGCDPDPHPVRLTPTGDDLTYTSDSAAEGNPVARMSRADD